MVDRPVLKCRRTDEKNQNLWIGTITEGVYLAQWKDGKLQELQAKDEQELKGVRIVFIKKIEKDIYVGTEKGLKKYDSVTATKLPLPDEIRKIKLEEKYEPDNFLLFVCGPPPHLQIQWWRQFDIGVTNFCPQNSAPKT